MADYAKISVKGALSKNSDYSFPKVTFAPDANTLTPDEYMHIEMEAATGGNTLTLTGVFSGITMLMIKNNDAAITVTARIDTAATANVDIAIPAGGVFVTPDCRYTEHLVLTSASGTPKCEIFAIGT
tara:strand:+ start:103 stop:483 length:381 start_codon:yes stop_codon:yes gene_type:complete